mgnify:CR=1 FL=1
MNTAKKFNLWMGIALLILCFFIIFVVYPLILILYIFCTEILLEYISQQFLCNRMLYDYCFCYRLTDGLCATQRQNPRQ